MMNPMAEETIAFGPFTLDRRRQVVTRHGAPVPIGHRGYVLLETLLDAGGAAVDKSTLIERAWPGTIVEEGNLATQIAALRKSLGHDAEALIVTVPRIGYRLVAPPAPPAADAAGPPLIAVLPFANLSGDPGQGYFADGVVEDVITALSRFKGFGVLPGAQPSRCARQPPIRAPSRRKWGCVTPSRGASGDPGRS
jgi:DNA-binding winged helix-turn-helix (wHTH) protein